jgi:hypothetical protein
VALQKEAVIKKPVEFLDVFVPEFSLSRFFENDAIRVFLDFEDIILGVCDDKIITVAGVEPLVENAACFSVRAVMLEPVFGDAPRYPLRAFPDQVPLGPVLEGILRVQQVPHGKERINALVDPVFKDDLVELAAVVVDFVVRVV